MDVNIVTSTSTVNQLFLEAILFPDHELPPAGKPRRKLEWVTQCVKVNIPMEHKNILNSEDLQKNLRKKAHSNNAKFNF